MRTRTTAVLLALTLATSALAKDVYLSVAGSANGFFTDARIFNPSFEKDITIAARYLPAANVDNSNVAPKTITIPKRSMAVYDDVVQSLFNGGAPLGAIRLTSDDDFIATQRIYADRRTAPQNGTLGQFVLGLDSQEALRKGVVMGLKIGAASLGSFRTNLGMANPNPVVATVNFKLYDRTNQVAATNKFTLQPYGVFSPTSVSPFFGAPNRDLTDSWFSFDSDQPVFVYGSVVDNGSTDPTFIPARNDSGVEPVEPEPKTMTVAARDFAFTVTGDSGLRAGDEVRFVLSKTGGPHGFRLFSPSGQIVIDTTLSGTPTERSLVLTAGEYVYVCSNGGCGSGHFEMQGAFSVAP
jgi:hypothetical protein